MCPFRGLVCSLAEEGQISYLPNGPTAKHKQKFVSGRAGRTASAGQTRTWIIDGFPYSQGQYFVSIIFTGQMGFPSFFLPLSRLGLFKCVIQKQVGWEREPCTFSSTTLHAFHLGLSNSNLTASQEPVCPNNSSLSCQTPGSPIHWAGSVPFLQEREKK